MAQSEAEAMRRTEAGPEMHIRSTPIQGVTVVQTSPLEDDRGFFFRAFCDQELAPLLGEEKIRQINISTTIHAGTVRGLHFQMPPHGEIKLVRCLRGKVWDVAVDLRGNSDSFLRWHAEELSADNNLMMVIPKGCAHGFQVLEPDSQLLYLHTEAYAPGFEGGVGHDDPRIGVSWPLPVSFLSPRDASHSRIPPGYPGLFL